MPAKTGLFRIFRFGLVGILASGTYALVVALLVEGLSVRPHVASVWGYLAGIPVSFFGQKHFTFRSKHNAWAEIVPFLIVQMVNIAASFVLMYLITEIMGLSHWIGIGAVILASAALAYLLLKVFVFIDRARSA